MSVTSEVFKYNKSNTWCFILRNLPVPLSRKLAIVACMYARLTVEEMLSLKTDDTHIIQNAGGIVIIDALRSLIISNHLLGTQEFMIINPADYGMLTFKYMALCTKLKQRSKKATIAPVHFHAFGDLEENIHQKIRKVEIHPWIPEHILVRGDPFTM